MKAISTFAVAVALLALVGEGTSLAGTAGAAPSTNEPLNIATFSSRITQTGGRSGLFKAATDSFNLYGGRRSDGTNDRYPEGHFQTIGFAPDPQGWAGVDLTENPVRWHASSFNAANLDAVPPVNHAMFCGVEAGEPGYTTAPGYGNNFNDNLDWQDISNPALNTSVRLEFDYNHDTEPGYDFFHAQYDSAGVLIDWLVKDGSNKDASGVFGTPAHFDDTVLFTPPMYTGNPPFFVHLRLKVTSDGAWSDEDGLWPTSGAAQVDNIKVYFNGSLADSQGDGIATFEDNAGDLDDEGWTPAASSFVGDFSKVLPQLRDTDPCRTNLSPQMGFVDDSTPPNNSVNSQTTGGQLSPNWSYGILGGWVVNYNGGLTFGAQSLNNEVWSPEIDWDDPNTTEDDALIGGAFIRFSVWQHLPLTNGIFWTWGVRSTDGGPWSSWQNRNFVYYGDGGGTYNNVQADVTDLLVLGPTKVQMALGVSDLATIFAFAGTDATPSPAFDAVSFWKYDSGGPAFSTRNIDLFNDGFATSGGTDFVGDPAAMSVRVDMARDISTGIQNTPGDSIIVDVVSTIPGETLNGPPAMKWLLEANPLFDGVRTIPAGASNVGTTTSGFTQWFGTVAGDSSRTSAGATIADRFFMDMPGDGPKLASYQTDEPAMFFPGDRIRYFIEATDTGANTTTLPADTTGFWDGAGYNRVFTVRALPTLVDDAGVDQPHILVVNDFGHRGGENDLVSAFGQNGMFEDVDFDTYTVQGPSSLVSNGIGSAGAHGATAPQLAGYDCLIYVSGNLSSGLISDGTNANGNDKGDDLGVLTGWHNLEGDRYMVHFGDELSTFLNGGGAPALTYLTTIMGVTYNDNNVRDDIGGLAAPEVQPTGAVPGVFTTGFVAYGGCLGINQFDNIDPIVSPTSVRSHTFTDGVASFSPAAGVWHDRSVILNSTPYRRVDVTFPFGFVYVQDLLPPSQGGGVSARTRLLEELLGGFGHIVNAGQAVGTDPVNSLAFAVDQNQPNPFNPKTTIRFTAPRRGPVAIRVYNVRGELVRTLLDEVVEPGNHPIEWNGTDDGGARVSSGVYLYTVDGFGKRVTRKMALVK